MKKSKFPSVAAKKPNYAPSNLPKIAISGTRKNVRSTGSAAVAKAAKAHRNTIVSTDNRTDTDNCLDDDTIAGFDTSIGHVNHADDDSDLDGLDLASSIGDTRLDHTGTGKRLNRATGADVDDFELDLDQPTAGDNSSDDGEGSDNIPPWDAGHFDAAQIKHVANCLCIDTIGLEFTGITPDVVNLAKTFREMGTDGKAVADSGWAKDSLHSPSGKRTLVVDYVPKTKKLSLEGSNAAMRQGHNVVASGDLTMTAYSMVKGLNKEKQVGWPPSVGLQLAHGNDVEVTRIDVFVLLKVPEGVNKAEFINALAIAGIRASLNTSLYVGESVYFDQGSQLEGSKFYDKEAELDRARKGGLPDVPGVEDLVKLVESTVRLECVFRGKRLVQIAKKHGGRPHPCLFTKELLAEMVLTLLAKYKVHGDVFRRLEHAELLKIKLPYRSTVAHWQNGEVLQDMVKSERVLKEHKRYLKTHHNKLDLDAQPPHPFHDSMSLYDILSPENFLPVPKAIRENPALFYQIDMEKERRSLRKRTGNGVSSVILDPYRASDVTIMLNGKPWAI